MEKIEGEVTSVRFFNQESGWAVFDLNVDDGAFGDSQKVTGCIYEVYPGQRLSLEGKVFDHPQYGKSFRFSSYRVENPTSILGIQKFLAFTLPNVGPVRAERIIEMFGAKTIEVLDERIEELKKIPGITDKDLPEIRSHWKGAKATRELTMFLAQFGMTKSKISKVLSRMSGMTITKLRQDPYVMTEVGGVGFKTVDAFALSMGITPNSPCRHRGAIYHSLTEASRNGNVFLTPGGVLAKLNDLKIEGLTTAMLPVESIKEHLQELEKKECIVLDDDKAYLQHLYFSENDSANFVNKLIEEQASADVLLEETELEVFIERYQENMRSDIPDFAFSEEQIDALKLANKSHIMVLTGLPGTGKTTTLRALTRMFEEASIHLALCAPTGKASKRLSNVTGRPSQTIHRLLGLGMKEEDREYLIGEKLAGLGALIIDEASMVDISLFAAIARSISTSCRVIIVGDPAQLPSVGPGAVLRDLKSSEKVPKLHLTHIHRQSQESDIVHNAHRVLHGEDLENRNKGDLRTLYHTTDTQIVSTLEKVAEKLKNVPGSYQILCPMKNVTVGTKKLNERLRKILNTSLSKKNLKWGDKKFFIGDQVIITKNLYHLGLHGGVVNGDTGVITDIDLKKSQIVVKVDGYDDHEVEFKGEDLSHLELSYVVTVHKSQGSEWDLVVVLLHKSHSLLLYRNLLYTAMTRAKKKLIIISDKSSVKSAAQKAVVFKRNTYLRERIDEVTS